MPWTNISLLSAGPLPSAYVNFSSIAGSSTDPGGRIALPCGRRTGRSCAPAYRSVFGVGLTRAMALSRLPTDPLRPAPFRPMRPSGPQEARFTREPNCSWTLGHNVQDFMVNGLFKDRSHLLKRKPAPRRRLSDAQTPDLIYAVGDVHGRIDLFDRLMADLAADAKRYSGPALLIMLGDYVDRGPDTQAVLSRLVTALPEGLNRICLAGNHEQMMLDFLNDPGEARHWLGNGGAETLASYGLPTEQPPEGAALWGYRRLLLRTIPQTHVRFLNALPVFARFGHLCFVHAGLRPDVAPDAQTDRDMMWFRYPQGQSGARSDCLTVHGHTPHDKVLVKPSRIDVDTGAVFSGRLSAAKFVDGAFVDVIAT